MLGLQLKLDTAKRQFQLLVWIEHQDPDSSLQLDQEQGTKYKLVFRFKHLLVGQGCG